MSSDLSRVRGFDGLRGLAAIAVFIEHKVRSGHGLGGLGVLLFFALSGFLIVGILHEQRTHIETGASGVRKEIVKFWARRALRIFPLYYAMLILICGYLLLKGKGILSSGIPWYAAYLSNFFIAHVAHGWSKFSHLWSLSVEQQFYLAAAPVFLCFPLIRHRPILLATLAGAALTLLLSAVLFDDAISLYLSPLPNFGVMAIGGMLALEAKQWAWTARRWNAVLVSGLLTVPAIVGIEHAIVRIERLGMPDPVQLVALRVLLSYWFAFCVIGYVSMRQDSRITRLLSLRSLAYIGTVSYGFYVFHLFSPSYDFVMRALRLPPLPGLVREYWFLAQFLMTLAAASLSWHFFEAPILRLKHSYRFRNISMG